jgi:hypothetical protein
MQHFSYKRDERTSTIYQTRKDMINKKEKTVLSLSLNYTSIEIFLYFIPYHKRKELA